MKKLITIIIAIMMIAAVSVSANAATIVPIGKTISFTMPSIKTPTIPAGVRENITETAKTAMVNNIMQNWNRECKIIY